MNRTFSSVLKDLRIITQKTLREFSEEVGMDAGNYSKVERGLTPPPDSNSKMERFANALNLTKGSNEWNEFFDLAAVSRGQLPRDILTDDEVVQQLPLLFRMLRGEPITPDKLDALVEKIRRQ